MFRKSKRACFSPGIHEKPTIILRHSSCSRVLRNRKRIIGTWSFRFHSRDPIMLPVRFLIRLGAKVTNSLKTVSLRRRSSTMKVSSSTLVSSHSLSDHLTDSHRAKAVADCIEFLHSSSSREAPSCTSTCSNC
ncbi:unnamed protein product [Vicia faba]|uniref:Josephin-like protein n=1 Tax=Vicia faba TaxID=3906 RepID=A0AAV0Z486_VICFA|nr:unnamed protein product [Vicia faba]